ERRRDAARRRLPHEPPLPGAARREPARREVRPLPVPPGVRRLARPCLRGDGKHPRRRSGVRACADRPAGGDPMRRVLLVACATILRAAVGLAAGAAEDATEGRVLYTRYCGACHGVRADGNGPIASVLRRPPTDLRHLGGRYGTPLASDEIARFV